MEIEVVDMDRTESRSNNSLLRVTDTLLRIFNLQTPPTHSATQVYNFRQIVPHPSYDKGRARSAENSKILHRMANQTQLSY